MAQTCIQYTWLQFYFGIVCVRRCVCVVVNCHVCCIWIVNDITTCWFSVWVFLTFFVWVFFFLFSLVLFQNTIRKVVVCVRVAVNCHSHYVSIVNEISDSIQCNKYNTIIEHVSMPVPTVDYIHIQTYMYMFMHT